MVFKDISLSPGPSPLNPLVDNPAFPPGLRDSRFSRLGELGLGRVSDYVVEEDWITIDSLQQYQRLASLGEFGLLQGVHFLKTLRSPILYTREKTVIENECLRESRGEHMLSKMYKQVIKTVSGNVASVPWEGDLNLKFAKEKDIDIHT